MTVLVFEYPGNIESFDWIEDGSSMAVTIAGTGSGAGTNQLTEYGYLLSTGGSATQQQRLPVSEDSVSFPTCTDPAQLNRLVLAEAQLRSAPITTPQLRVRGDMEPSPGSYRVGDHIRVRINGCPRFPTSLYPNGYDAIWRIVKISVKPQGTADEQITLDIAQYNDSTPPT